MKKSTILLLFIFLAVFANAQKKSAGSTTKIITTTPDKYTQVLADGRIVFTRILTKSSDSYVTSYTLVGNGQSEQVNLNKQSFDRVFTQTSRMFSEKWDDLSKYVKDKALTFDQEKDWITMVRYYNKLNPLPPVVY